MITKTMPRKKSKQALQQYDAHDPERPAGERWVTMSNRLARAGHGLTLGEKRLVMSAVAVLDSARMPPAGQVPITRITAADYAATFKVDADTAYDQLQSASETLLKRIITFYEAAERRSGKPLPPTKVQMHWVGQAKYQKGEGWVELYWWPLLVPHLMGLKKQFTSYQLQQASALRSAYSWKLLELLTRFQSTGRAEYTIEDFVTSMGATEKQIANFAKVRIKIIEPAVKELCEKDGWQIEWIPIKAGRRVKALRFVFQRDPQGPLLV